MQRITPVTPLDPAGTTPPREAAPAGEATAPDTVPVEPAAEVAAAWEALPSFQPARRALKKGRVLAEGGREAAPFDVLRTRVLQQCAAHGWRRVGLTSPGPACGKSLVSLNLGYSLSRLDDQRVLLAEADLRRPSLARTLGLRDPVSFARVLAGDRAFADEARRLAPNFALVANQGPARSPAELLQTRAAGTALAAAEARFEPTVFLFDLPPMLVNDDTLAFLPRLDAVLIVAAADETSVDEVDLCEREVAAHTRVMGVVLNKCRHTDRGYGYAYYG
jgi:Mrp family chromosome partitioning ATPase